MSRKSRENAVRQQARSLDPGAVSERLRTAADAIDTARSQLDLAVADARAAGLNWSQIGGQIGLTRQGARQRFDGN